MKLCGLRASFSGVLDRSELIADSGFGTTDMFASKEEMRFCEICFLPGQTALRTPRVSAAWLPID
jgi:hypothetical protein